MRFEKLIAVIGLSASSFMVDAASVGASIEQNGFGIEATLANVYIGYNENSSQFQNYRNVTGNIITNNDSYQPNDVSSKAFKLGYQWQLSDNWSVIPRVGMITNSLDGAQDDNTFLYGVGVRYTFDHLYIGLSYDRGLSTSDLEVRDNNNRTVYYVDYGVYSSASLSVGWRF